jgi:phospholipase/carboxylesterase
MSGKESGCMGKSNEDFCESTPEIAFPEEFGALGLALVETMTGIETFQRRFHPPMLHSLLDHFRPTAGRFAQALSEALARGMTTKDTELEALLAASKNLFEGVELLFDAGNASAAQAVFFVMRAMRKYCRAQEIVFPLSKHWPRMHRYFLDPGARAGNDPDACGIAGKNNEVLMHVGGDSDPYARGAFSFYVPPAVEGHPRGVVVALHGGQGHGRDFLWTWLREVRSRNLMLIAPSSTGPTWNLMNPDEDLALIEAALDHLAKQWPVDPKRVLLTGISDGGTFSLTCCQLENTRFSGFAPISGVLAPVDIRQSKGKRVYWVHGRLDWMFPVQRAVTATQLLRSAGCDVTLRVIDDLSHTYPREANMEILDWSDISSAGP